jgi:hypothetical protein
MYTSLVLFALVGSAVPSAEASGTPAWLDDYGAACRKGRMEKKPLAIFFGRGKAGWEQVTSGGPLGEGATRLLQSGYVPVYFDLDTDRGRGMAAAFGVKGGPALVLSDRSGAKVALHYTGTLAPADLHRCLARYADPDRVVWTTHTDPAAADDLPTSYQAALDGARRAERRLVLVFQGPRCPWCRKMEHETFADGRVQAALRKYVVYVVDTDREPDVLEKFLPSSPIPAYCVVDPADETVRKGGNSFRPPADFLAWLE